MVPVLVALMCTPKSGLLIVLGRQPARPELGLPYFATEGVLGQTAVVARLLVLSPGPINRTLRSRTLPPVAERSISISKPTSDA